MENPYRVLLKEAEIRAGAEKLIIKLQRENAKLLARAVEAEKGFEILVDELKADGEVFSELYPKIEALEEENECLKAQVAAYENVLEIARELVDYETRTFSRSKYVKKLKRALIELEGVKE